LYLERLARANEQLIVHEDSKRERLKEVEGLRRQAEIHSRELQRRTDRLKELWDKNLEKEKRIKELEEQLEIIFGSEEDEAEE